MHLPSEINLFLDVEYDALHPQLTLTWIRPEGKQLEFFRGTPGRSTRFSISKEIGLDQAYGGNPEEEVQTGEYALQIEAFAFEEEFSMTGRLVVYGRVHGIAGTDNLRRDLLIGLLWGMPIGLAFGLLATIGTTLLGFTLAALGSWFGGWGDAVIQRLTEVNMMLPLLPILIMVGKFYSSSIWVMLGVIIALSTFTGTIKTYRAMFLQARNASYIEAARAYGASHGRIIFRYLMPRIIPVLVPTFVLGIPRFVFLEASLGLLGLSDPILPTWGKILTDAYQGGALYRGHYYWLLEPAVLLMVAGLSFSMLGFALDRLFNPRLRGI
jgi:peptide/nickel transport system permease protein